MCDALLLHFIDGRLCDLSCGRYYTALHLCSFHHLIVSLNSDMPTLCLRNLANSERLFESVAVPSLVEPVANEVLKIVVCNKDLALCFDSIEHISHEQLSRAHAFFNNLLLDLGPRRILSLRNSAILCYIILEPLIHYLKPLLILKPVVELLPEFWRLLLLCDLRHKPSPIV